MVAEWWRHCGFLGAPSCQVEQAAQDCDIAELPEVLRRQNPRSSKKKISSLHLPKMPTVDSTPFALRYPSACSKRRFEASGTIALIAR